MASIQKHSAIQGTLTTQYRSPHSPRKQQEYSENVRCLGCWNPNATHHPCLFCENCLATMKAMMSISNQQSLAKPYQMNMSKSESFDSQDSDLTAFEKHGHLGKSKKRQLLRTPRTKEVIINSSLGLYSDSLSDVTQSPEPSTENQVQDEARRQRKKDERRRWAILAEKAQQSDKTATRCGFCALTDPRKQLVLYCIHCKKHLCAAHRSFHANMRIYRPHATIDLERGTNAALM